MMRIKLDKNRWPMRIDNPNRPKGGLGDLLMQDGNNVPSLRIVFLPNGKSKIDAWFQVKEASGFRYRSYDVTFKDSLELHSELEAFEANPEATILDWFGYDVNSDKPQPTQWVQKHPEPSKKGRVKTSEGIMNLSRGRVKL